MPICFALFFFLCVQWQTYNIDCYQIHFHIKHKVESNLLDQNCNIHNETLFSELAEEYLCLK